MSPPRFPGWNMLAVYAAVCFVRGFEFGLEFWWKGGVSLESLARTILFGAQIFACGLPVFFAAAWMLRATREQPPGKRAWKLAAVLVGLAPVFGVSLHALGLVFDPQSETSPAADVAGFAIWVLTVGGPMVAIALLVQRQADTAAAEHAERVASARREREWDEIRLRFLRSQIEPHFLFNALANVKRLYETHPQSGREMLRALEEYIQRALSVDPAGCRTVADELSLTRAYLDIFAVRMGNRLRVELDVPDDLHRAPLPPLMLGTLVENALKHGIAPRAEGGTIRIRVRGENRELLVQVSDDGVGFRETSGSGIGLANTRARLATLFGARGRLDLARNPGGGVVATLRMPLEAAP
ncbi:MAG TPA: histidine kinase [Usitatibacter sp.]|nr:histidine kinase [Usitatibacter sp.]